jgi:hypothetical protein
MNKKYLIVLTATGLVGGHVLAAAAPKAPAKSTPTAGVTTIKVLDPYTLQTVTTTVDSSTLRTVTATSTTTFATADGPPYPIPPGQTKPPKSKKNPPKPPRP